MRFADLFWMALSALWQRPARTALTTSGVLLGTFVLASTLAIAEGVQSMIVRQLRKQDQLRRVTVWKTGGVREEDVPPRELQITGDMSDARRARLREAVLRRWRRPAARPPTGLTDEDVEKLKRLPHVQSVTPALGGSATAFWQNKRIDGAIVTAAADDVGGPRRMVAGRYLDQGQGEGVLISEFAAYRWGFENEADVESLVGQKVRLAIAQAPRAGATQLLALLDVGGEGLTGEQRNALESVARKLPLVLDKMDLTEKERKVLADLLEQQARPKPHTEELIIVGVFRDLERSEQGPWDGPIRGVDLMVPPEVSKRMYYKRPGARAQGLPYVILRVDDERHLEEVQKGAVAQGLEAFSLAEVVQQVHFTVLLISAGCTLVALTALAVAGLGITNTMLMSVLQRTHEIGVMKAVGARDSQVMTLFLLEGALVGAMGAGLGLLLAWLASFPGDRLAAHLIEKQTPMRLDGSVYEFTTLAVLVVPLGVILWTTLAAASPARRAARIDPIEALRSR